MLPDAVANALSTARVGSLRTLAVDVDEQLAAGVRRPSRGNSRLNVIPR